MRSNANYSEKRVIRFGIIFVFYILKQALEETLYVLIFVRHSRSYNTRVYRLKTTNVYLSFVLCILFYFPTIHVLCLLGGSNTDGEEEASSAWSRPEITDSQENVVQMQVSQLKRIGW